MKSFNIMNPGHTVEMQDISAEVFGKYQFCTMVDGHWYADSDFSRGAGCGALKDGAIADDGFVYRKRSWLSKLFSLTPRESES